MDYQQTLEYLFGQLPMYQRQGKAAYKADLSSTLAFDEIQGHPHRSFKSIHIAGTNGKGSCSHMLASILQECGLKVGLYTSPHLIDFRERIRINGEIISEDYVVNFVKRYKSSTEQIKPSFFEWSVALAFEYFKDEAIDIAVIETGMGGRLDSTNIISPELCIITNIGMDHQQFLGDSIEKIAAEKAGIIKEQTPVLIGTFQKACANVFKSKAKPLNAPLHFVDEDDELFETDLKGFYQKANQRTVLKACKLLNEQGYSIKEECIEHGLKKVFQNTGLRGRWEQVAEDPVCIADVGHNVDGIKLNMLQLKTTPHEQLHIVWGMVDDKDLVEVMSLLPHNALYYLCKAQIPRSCETNKLMQIAEKIGLKAKAYESVPDAYRASRMHSNKGDLVYIGGSTFVVADLLNFLID